MSQRFVHKVFLKEDGSFTHERDRIFYVGINEPVKLQLSSKHFKTMIPILLTNLNQKMKSKSKFMRLLEIHEDRFITRKEIEDKYKAIYGEFDDEGNWNCEISFEDPLTYFCQVVFFSPHETTSERYRIRSFGRPEWFVVEPECKINGKKISPRSLIMQTLLPKCMGPIHQWEPLIKAQTDLNYNSFHFAPLQQYGGSDSSYSIADQLGFDSKIFPNMDRDKAFKLLSKTLKEFEKKYSCLFFIDIVPNHTSFDSPWLLECPNATYNLENTPSLNCAWLFDDAVQEVSRRIMKGQLKEFPEPFVRNQEDVNKVMDILTNQILPERKIHETFLMDVGKVMSAFRTHLKKVAPDVKLLEQHIDDDDELYNVFTDDRVQVITQLIEKNTKNLGASYHGATFDMEKVCEYFKKNPAKCSYEMIQVAIKKLNDKNEKIARGYVDEAVGTIRQQLYWGRVVGGNHEVSDCNQLVSPYFTVLSDGTKCANNGWLYVQDVMEDFADCEHFHYLRRHVQIWGDLVKLRYGKSKEDCPYLWNRMKQHVQEMATAFHGFRVDNSHSTPIHVCEWMLRKARKANPYVYVFAELFTETVETDALYTKRVGFNCLVRESMRVMRPGDLASDIYRFSGENEYAVGSLDRYFEKDDKSGELVHLLKPKQPAGIYYDLTHDNMSFNHSRTFMDSLPTCALLCLSNSLLATTKGFDEFYETNPSVVSERRTYALENDFEGVEHKAEHIDLAILTYMDKEVKSLEVKGSWDGWNTAYTMKNVSDNLWKTWVNVPAGKHEFKFLLNGEWHVDPLRDTNENSNHILETSGTHKVYKNITPARRTLNMLHQKVCNDFPEFFIYQPTDDVITINRENKSRTHSYVLISRSAFKRGPNFDVNFSIDLPGRIVDTEMIYHVADYIDERPNDEKYLKGMQGRVIQETDLSKFANIFITSNPANNEMKYHSIRFHLMPPSFVCVLKVALNNKQVQAVEELEKLTKVQSEDLYEKFAKKMSPNDLNVLVFSCTTEEKERSYGSRDVYTLPSYGPLPYAGFGSLFQMVRQAQIHNDLSIPLFQNLRGGNWLLDYYTNRLEGFPNLHPIRDWIDTQFKLLKVIPRHLIPRYFVKIVNLLRGVAEQKSLEILPQETETLKKYTFFRSLILASYQFVADIPSGKVEGFHETLSAGLPHFATGWSRCWGRDTFISFKGGLLIPGLHRIARDVIIMFAGSMRHGLLPNLLDRSKSPRYNCRDATWWFIRAIGDYISFTNDSQILEQEVNMSFLSDDQKEHEERAAKGEQKSLKLMNVVFEIFQKHATGIKFREWNAGDQIDGNMRFEGFNVELNLDEDTGFVVGGNPYNCLTWMDKMGSSEKASNKGTPATPRDGAPIDMTALLKHCLSVFVTLNEQKKFPYSEVTTRSGAKLSFKDWAEKIQQSFETHYWIPEREEEFQNYRVNSSLVSVYGIYKDTILSKDEKIGYKLRPNACIALSVAPELFTHNHAYRYLRHVEKMLIGNNSLGLKTLDPRADEYIAYYDNADDSHHYKIAHGFSYHNGPEWVWIYGMFLKAGIKTFSKELSFAGLMSFLSRHKEFLQKNDWISLPEMTNHNGEVCYFSCPAQAWSIAVILEAYYEARLTLKKDYF